MNNIPYGKIGYAAHLQELGDKLQSIRQRKRDLEARILTHGETPTRRAGVERLGQEEAVAKAAYDRATTENC